MHRLGYIHAIAGSIALILPALLAGNASAEFFAPEVFGRAPQHVTTTEPAPRYNLHNARLQPEPENTELTSSKARLYDRWISLQVNAPQYDQPPPPRLRF